jgi:hypothetical protein
MRSIRSRTKSCNAGRIDEALADVEFKWDFWVTYHRMLEAVGNRITAWENGLLLRAVTDEHQPLAQG